MTQIPLGPKDCFCPFHKKETVDKEGRVRSRPARMSEVCHTCPLWVQLRGKDPQSHGEIDQWNCSLAWLPLMLIETAQQMRQAGASTDKVATEVKKFHDGMAQQNREMKNLLAGPGGIGG